MVSEVDHHLQGQGECLRSPRTVHAMTNSPTGNNGTEGPGMWPPKIVPDDSRHGQDTTDPDGWRQRVTDGVRRAVAAVVASVKRQREAVQEEGPVGLLGYYVDGDRTRWEIACAIAAVLVVVIAVLGIALAILETGYNAMKGAVADFSGTGIVETVNEPVRAYLRDHSAGLPITADTLWGTWSLAILALWIWAVFGSWGGRVGWTLMGAMTIAMVWAGAPHQPGHDARWTAAGLTLTMWAVLSVLAFHGSFRRARVVVVPPPQPPAGEDR
jgi:hypothetical protein